MRNLRNIAFGKASPQSELPLTATAWDTNNDSVICAFGPTPTHPTIELKRKTGSRNTRNVNGSPETASFAPITSWDAPCPLPDLACDEILLMHHFPENATTCIILAGGDLVLVREEPEPDQEAIEIVGSIDVGISAAAWAPDEELLAIVTRSDGLMIMSRNLEPITETSMTVDDLQASQHVSVGWGKKETQFQGKRAKAMRDPTMPEHVDDGKQSQYDDGAVMLSWRGDGAFLAVNSMVSNHRRVIRVFSREGGLDSVSEPVDGLEAAISWKPSGSLIASIKRSSGASSHEKLEVVFFERNGLRHGEFLLRLDPSEAREKASKIRLVWNLDSSVLAVCLLDSVQFWTMGNYHYYLKQEVKVSSKPQDVPVSIKWHPEKALKCILNDTKDLLNLEYILQVCKGSTLAPNDLGLVTVVDGSLLKITPLRQAGVPPPMSFCEINTQSNIIDCAISRNNRRIAVVTQSSIHLYESQQKSPLDTPKTAIARFSAEFKELKVGLADIGKPLINKACLQLCFRGDNVLYILAPPEEQTGAICYRVDLATDHCDQWDRDHAVINIASTDVPATTQNLLSDTIQENLWVQDADSTRIFEDSSDVSPSSGPIFENNQANTAIFLTREASHFDTFDVSDALPHQVYLTTKGSLYVDDRLLVRDCTSFVITDMHIVFTTAQHLLKFVHITQTEEMEVPGDTPEVDERCRSVERGAKVVTVVPSIYAVVLQMPRGNLETIYPRVLVLSGIRKSLQTLDYRTAFLACQNHQVDMNILYDHLPKSFMANVDKFVQDLKKPSRIDEFLSKLKDEDVTQTLYKDTLKVSGSPVVNGVHIESSSSAVPNSLAGAVDKVNQICNTFISTLTAKGSKHLQNVITAHVCKRPPDLAAALSMVSSLRQSSPDEADLAIAHLCFLTDTNRLYDAALALYDLQIALLVAQNAQRDPKEYMPFLQSLQAMPALRRQYTIDNHLRNYSRALSALHALTAHDEVQAYTIKHILYTTALELYKYDPEHMPKMTILYAEYLESQSQYASAAVLYESLGDNNMAYPLYALAHQWRESLACASLIPLDEDKLRNHAVSLATTCADESRDYRSAATIQVEYLADYAAAARLLCKGSYFADATRVLALHNLRTEIPTIVDPGLTEKFGEIIELVAECKAQLGAQIPRIRELRQKKEEDPLAFYGGDAAAMAADGIDIPDNISLAATNASTVGGQTLFTRYGSNASKFGGTVASNVSRKTSKTKRREERKRAAGKKGSVYEEEYLVSSVRRLIERINAVQDEVKRLTNGLLRRGMREQGAKVDEVMREIGELCEKARREVWQVQDLPVGDQATTSYDVNGEGRPGGADGVFWDSQQEVNGVSKKSAPDMKIWVGNPLVVK